MSVEEPISVVRYVGVKADNWPSGQNRSEALDPNHGFADLYTRFVILPLDQEGRGAGTDGPLRSYKLERRNWLSRIFTEKTLSVVTVAKIAIMEPELPLTLPLYSVSYSSGGKQEENWATALTSSHVRSPLFRITPSSRFAVNLTTKVSNDVQSSGVTAAVSALTTAVQMAAPQAGILTALSQKETKNRANALDGAISTLLSYSIDEDVEIGRMLWSWRPDSAIVLHGCAPFVRTEDEGQDPGGGKCANDEDLDGGRNRYVGSWRLTLTCPQFSIFSARTICRDGADAPFEDISDAAARKQLHGEIAATVPDSLVLTLAMAENVTLRSFVRSSDYFTQLVSETSPDDEAFGRFCAGTMSGLQAQGLTGLDSGLGLRATLRLMPEFVTDLPNLRSAALGQSCRRLLSDYEISL